MSVELGGRIAILSASRGVASRYGGNPEVLRDGGAVLRNWQILSVMAADLQGINRYRYGDPVQLQMLLARLRTLKIKGAIGVPESRKHRSCQLQGQGAYTDCYIV